MRNSSSIVIVEDSSTQAIHLQHLLESSYPGYSIHVARDGQQGLRVVEQTKPRLIISDIVMPIMDGYEMCARLKEQQAYSEIPIILLTSLSDPEDIIKGLNAGTDFYLTKPFEEQFLLERVDSILRNPQGAEPKGDSSWKVDFAGKSHVVHVDLQQMLNLLLSTYENAVQQNRKLLSVQEELRRTNESLEERVQQRTEELSTANEQLRVEIGERKRAEQRLQLQLRRLDALRQIDAAITGSLDLRLTLNVLLDQVTTQLQVDAADVLLQRQMSHRLEYAAGRGFRHRARIGSHHDYSKGPAGLVVKERSIRRIDDLVHADEGPLDAELLAREEFVAYMALPLVSKGKALGVLEVFTRKPLAVDQEWMDFVEALAGQAAIAIDSAQLFEGLQVSNAELMDAYETTLEGWSKALDLRDKETEGHSLRVTEMTERIAQRLGVDEEELLHLRRGALLHDIGKLGVPDAILRKPGPLTEEERTIMQRHAENAFDLLSPIAFLRSAIDIPYCHHERWDGEGYPRGLKGEQIPLGARIFAIADVWDALRSDRPYRKACSRSFCIEHIRDLSGKHFDPRIVEAFLSLYLELGAEIDGLPDTEDNPLHV